MNGTMGWLVQALFHPVAFQRLAHAAFRHMKSVLV